jgi:hypothetical protein
MDSHGGYVPGLCRCLEVPWKHPGASLGFLLEPTEPSQSLLGATWGLCGATWIPGEATWMGDRRNRPHRPDSEIPPVRGPGGGGPGFRFITRPT